MRKNKPLSIAVILAASLIVHAVALDKSFFDFNDFQQRVDAVKSNKDTNDLLQSASSKKSYLVLMEGEPLVSEFKNNADTSDISGKEIKLSFDSKFAKAHVELLIEEHLHAASDAELSEKDVVYNYVNTINGFSAFMTPEQVTLMKQQEGVVAVMKDELMKPTTDSSSQFMGLINEEKGTRTSDYDGEGVVVGVIDTGIWPEHPSFADDGTYPTAPDLNDSMRSNCDFGQSGHNENDVSFSCNNKLIGARMFLDTYRQLAGIDDDEFDSARDDDGHGSHVASTAAGNANVEAILYGNSYSNISGVAPRAQIIAYKGCGKRGCLTSDLTAAIDQAVADGVDVINFSIGGGASPPQSNDLAFLNAANAGVFVATSAGNSGPSEATIGKPATMPWITSVGASTQSRFFQGTVSAKDGAWTFTGASAYDSPDPSVEKERSKTRKSKERKKTKGKQSKGKKMKNQATVNEGQVSAPLVDAEFAGDKYCRLGMLDPNKVAGKIVLCQRGLVARVEKSLAVLEAGGVGMIHFNTNDSGDLFPDSHFVPAVHIDNTPGLAIKEYISKNSDASAIIGFDTIGALPYAPSMASFSSRGVNPTFSDIMKPDITAPGVDILAAWTPNSYERIQNLLFNVISGTSMSSPHIAGIFALIKQAHPDWSAAAARSAIMTTAYQDVIKEDRTTMAVPFDMGSGHVDNELGWLNPGLVYNTEYLHYLAVLCGAYPQYFGANPVISCEEFFANAGISTDSRDLNYPSITIDNLVGIHTVKRTVTSVDEKRSSMEYRVKVDAPLGYDVHVEPSKFKLENGESATYSLTVTRIDATFDQWAFGSVTWVTKKGKFSAYSPLAVRAMSVVVPSTIDLGENESGSTSFDIQLGYNGNLDVTAHGLVPVLITKGNVEQDPEQQFEPFGPGTSLHRFEVMPGALHFRIAIPPEATENSADLDIYVFDPEGNLAGLSGAPDTDELVDVHNPMAGNWYVFVHGWFAPSDPTKYDLYTWIIPSMLDDNTLSVDSAPTSATIGVETITLSWTNAELGKWYLGMVLYMDENKELDFTIIEAGSQ